MNTIEFTNYLKTPKEISKDQTTELEIILEEYPYFQAAQFLYLNGLKNQNSFKYNNILKKTAAYTSDRTVLFDFISSYEFNFFMNDDRAVSEYFEIENLEVVDNKSEKPVKTNKKIEIASSLPIGLPLQFDLSDNHSFNEWLQISAIRPIQRSEENETKEITSKKKEEKSNLPKSNFDLIEKFIASNPKIKPANRFEKSNLVFDSTIENDSLMTETLAHVYLEQKKYQKAITAFTVLSLKYPEKSSFFAVQIQAIKKLQEK